MLLRQGDAKAAVKRGRHAVSGPEIFDNGRMLVHYVHPPGGDMDERKEQSLTKAGLAVSVVTAVAASICCIGPIAAAFLGLTSFAALVK